MGNVVKIDSQRNTDVVINGIVIRQDEEGRYFLNDFHKGAGGELRHKPSRWTENQQTQELIEEIGKAGTPALRVAKGGRTGE
jgi:hypothetical protein